MNILFVGDIFAQPGRRVAAALIPELVQQREVSLVIANGENAAGGFGLTDRIARKLHRYGADIITSGNHIWDRREFIPYLDQSDRVLRPFNYPKDAPGIGATIVAARGGPPVAVLCLQGRIGMPTTDCPFPHGPRRGRALCAQRPPSVFVDFHAEATSEKMAMGFHLDGLATAVIGTHTHVQTADERILPKGTAYLTDAGMTGIRRIRDWRDAPKYPSNASSPKCPPASSPPTARRSSAAYSSRPTKQAVGPPGLSGCS